MKFETYAEWEEMRDKIALKRDRAKACLEKIYADEMAPIHQALYDLQSRCKHSNKVVTEKNGIHTEKCDVCGWGCCYGPMGTALCDEPMPYKDDFITLLRRKDLL
jgi:hypothetical protein